MKVYLEIVPRAGSSLFAEFGSPASAGVAITLDGIRDDTPYDEIVFCLDLDAIARVLGVERSELVVITPEEYEERYGDEDDE